jgi:hypothetical protein
MTRPASPYLAPGFYDKALAQGRHRDIVGGRWDETGRLQMQILQDHGLQPHHCLADIGAGSLRLGCKAVPYLDPGHYWATDASRALMLRGHETELPDPTRLPLAHLIEDSDFALPGLPDVDFIMVWGVFTHLPPAQTRRALDRICRRWPRAQALLFTVFEAPPESFPGPYRQLDGVVTHPDRPPWHIQPALLTAPPDWAFARLDQRLPRGQALWLGRPANHPGR